MPLEHLVAILGAVIGATWVLSRALSKIETALSGHVSKDTAEHKALDARVIKLEKRRDRR